MKRKNNISFFLLSIIVLMQSGCNPKQSADLLLINGKIVTTDNNFSIAEAVAISKDRIADVGTNARIMRLKSGRTKIIDLKGRTVIPGLIDSHLHPESASLSESEEEIPDVHTIDQLLSWIKDQAVLKEKGNWIIFPKFFSTRLMELRQPTLTELDNVAPDHPIFLNGSFGGMINSAAMKLSGITGKTVHPGIIKDKKTGLPTGFIRASAFNLLKIPQKKSTFLSG